MIDRKRWLSFVAIGVAACGNREPDPPNPPSRPPSKPTLVADAADPHTYADAWQDATRMTGSIVVTHLDGDWVCGRIDVSGPGGHIRGRFAAEVRQI